MTSIPNTGHCEAAHRHPRIWRLACGAVALLLACAPAFAAPTPKVPALTLVYDRTPAACHYLLHLYNRDLARKGYVDTRAHRVFRAIHWHKVTGPVPSRDALDAAVTSFEAARFDLTNAGVPQWVVKVQTSIGNDNVAGQQLFIMNAPPGNETDLLRQFSHPVDPVYARPVWLGGPTEYYRLTHVPPTRVAPHFWSYPAMDASATALRPLRYQGTIYVSASTFAWHGRIRVGNWVVIGVARRRNILKAICYFKSRAAAPVYRR
ncbi:MAG: hypothetical protein ACYCVY_11255 [Acidiferrobacteraceae bacterium]